jgi:hypothetical protein
MRKTNGATRTAAGALLLFCGLRLLVRHGLSCLAAAAGRLLHPGDALAELPEAGGIRRAIALLYASADPSARVDRRARPYA